MNEFEHSFRLVLVVKAADIYLLKVNNKNTRTLVLTSNIFNTLF